MPRVLLVDDEEPLRARMGRQLERAGHTVSFAEDGMCGLEKLKAEEFDVVVSDMKMPRLDGIGLLERAVSLAPDTEFIILTGHGSMESAVEAFKRGNLFDYLLKPLEDIHELDAVVERAAERRRLRLENRGLMTELQQRICELEDARARLAYQAERDGLTGALNYRGIHTHLDELLARDAARPVAILMIDMDDFKLLNDTYGHPFGDTALKHAVDVIQRTCGEQVELGRYGGDEFVALIPDCDTKTAVFIGTAVRDALSRETLSSPNGAALPLHASIGVADSSEAGRSAIELISAADAALYEGKMRGGDEVVLHASIHSEDANQEDRTAFGVLDGLVTSIDNKDRYTRAHSRHMTDYAMQLVQELNCSAETINTVRIAGLLHDVGKIGVPDSILRKPGKLTPEEYEIMKGHATLSALIIHGLPRLSEILDAVSHHHERWDG
ncbi:MAG TPA: diguanylate cyclase, partial [Chthonomonadales bacterium]|nr:diguanylate cyclase [Chthonomonadales bacterium]